MLKITEPADEQRDVEGASVLLKKIMQDTEVQSTLSGQWGQAASQQKHALNVTGRHHTEQFTQHVTTDVIRIMPTIRSLPQKRQSSA